MNALELWAGPECTINRVGEEFGDQLMLSRHYDRVSDLDLLTALPVSALRYPVLWEKIAPDRPDSCDWEWQDIQLGRLQTAGLRVIAGLVHHGSGPRYTNLLDPGFPQGLAQHAGRVAARYDWIQDWTPVNEPLTTARFSTLYGHWYPHAREEDAFWLALVNQIDGVRLAMREIRRINPAARLIQTEDLGRTYATVALREQAAFENQRRWASWDLLCGTLTPHHPLWGRLCRLGLEERLRAIADDPCPPDVIGVNHYLTSERFLDHRLTRYPVSSHGGSGLGRYADVEAIRVLEPPPAGLAGVLREAWHRYRIPIAVTEVHNGCTREEQMRWMAQAWDTALALRRSGVAITAITAWAALGSHGWNTLLTKPGHYEPGAYDVRGGMARATAMVPLLHSLTDGTPRHIAAEGAGWWQRPIRLLHPAVPWAAPIRDHGGAAALPASSTRPLLICGATGTLGQALARACEHRNLSYVLTDRSQLDLGSERSIETALDEHAPWAVINAAGWVRVDAAEGDPDGCFLANTQGPTMLARACAHRDIATVDFSSDLVFDGRIDRAYVETDATAPLSVYGRSKAAMEDALLALSGAHLIIRTAAFFSPFDVHNFASAAVQALSGGQRFYAAGDQIVSPAYVPGLVDATLDLLIDGETGLWHLANDGAVSWVEFAHRIADACGLNNSLIASTAGHELGWIAPRPRRSALASRRGDLMGSLDAAIGRFAGVVARSAFTTRIAA